MNVRPLEPVVPKGFELLDGKLIEMACGALSSWVAGQALYRLWQFDRDNRSGWLFPSSLLYRCFPQTQRFARRADASFIRRERQAILTDDDCRIAPDLIMEVVAPGETAEYHARKVEMFLTVGTRLVWVIDPNIRLAAVYRPDGSVRQLREPAELDGEDVLPGFRCPLAAILPPVPAGTPPA